MKNKSAYRTVDLILLLLIEVGLEAAILWAANSMKSAAVYTISVVLPITLIVMMRWGAYGIINAAIGGLAYAIGNGGEPTQYAIYIIGNCFIALNLLWFKLYGKKLKENVLLCILFVITGYLEMAFGRGLTGLMLTGNFAIIRLLAVDSLSCVVAIIIVLIARRQDGVFEDQDEYLKRISEKRD